MAAALIAGCAPPDPPRVIEPRPPADVEPTMTAPVNGGNGAELSALEIDFELVAEGLTEPLFATGTGDGSGRLFVAEKTGAVRIVRNGELEPDPFLDISDNVSGGSEQGLLGIAFTPDFEESGVLYVSYTDPGGTSVLSRFESDGERVDAGSETEVMRVEQPFANHNGGGIKFGPDGYLYFGLGDGGSGGDPQGNGQDPSTLLGSMLRIDVGEPGAWTDEAGVPDDNPFAENPDAHPLVWSYGLRNPWRFSFDRQTGDLWIADVGQSALEEVNFQPAGSGGGENWGWNLFEGTAPYPPDREVTEDRDAFDWPIVEYPHPTGRSITGGYVYRGREFPAMQGVYLYGDYMSGRVWGAARQNAEIVNRELAETDMGISSFSEDDDGELYVTDLGGGAVYRVVAR